MGEIYRFGGWRFLTHTYKKHSITFIFKVLKTCDYSLIAFDERVTFCFNTSGHYLVRVHMLHYLRVGSRITIMQSHTHTMKQMHMHKAVTGHVEAKKLLSSRRQSEYRHINAPPAAGCLHSPQKK